ncbi:MAG: LytR/AlgR family response regulator transcription factor [Bacteroidota bacterium]
METPRYKVIVIDDEAPARRFIKNLLNAYPQVEVIEECADGFEGAKKVMETKPDFIFLDIQMPRISGMEMLELLEEEHLPLTIFTTAYDQFAIQSFEYNTCDYLLKPIVEDRFHKAMTKVLQRLESGKGDKLDVSSLSQKAAPPGSYLEKIVIRSGNHIQVVYCEDLLCIEANDDYVILHTTGDQWVKKQTLKYYESRLNPGIFLRIHRSFIVNTSQISRIEPYSKDAYIAVLKNNQKISVSKSGYSKLKEQLDF